MIVRGGVNLSEQRELTLWKTLRSEKYLLSRAAFIWTDQSEQIQQNKEERAQVQRSRDDFFYLSFFLSFLGEITAR